MKKILLSQIEADPDQPRQIFEVEPMSRLVTSIKEKGILNPLLVEQVSKDRYLLIDGERRYRASKELKLKEVPVEVMTAMKPNERMVMRFHLQEQHQSWSPFDKARAIFFFMSQEGLNYRQVAELLGMNEETVSNWVGLLKLSKKSQEASIERKIPFSYLHSLVKAVVEYKEISPLKTEEIEQVLLEKIKSKAIYRREDFTNLLKILRSDEPKALKLKFLNNKDFTVNNLIKVSPYGKSINLDLLMQKARILRYGLNRNLKNKNSLVGEQKYYLENLAKEIDKFIN